MFKDSYKIIFIKEGKYNFKQLNFSLFQIISFSCIFFSFLFFLFFIFSNQFSTWTSKAAIKKHQSNNEVLMNNYKYDKARIDTLIKQLEKIKNQDELLRKLVKLPPIHDDIRKMGFGGADDTENMNDLNYLLPVDDFNFEEMDEALDKVQRLIKLESLSYDEISDIIETDKNRILAYPAIYPVTNGESNLSSNFGYRLDPFSKKYRFHGGHDFSSRTGSAVFSTANGRVIKSKYWGSFGNYIEVDHGGGYVTAYGHLSKRNVKLGDKVSRGQKIGEVGNTGRSTAPHLHYEVKHNNKSVDPIDYYFEISIN